MPWPAVAPVELPVVPSSRQSFTVLSTIALLGADMLQRISFIPPPATTRPCAAPVTVKLLSIQSHVAETAAGQIAEILTILQLVFAALSLICPAANVILLRT